MIKSASAAASCIEVLETRIAPATLDVVGGALVFTAGAGAANSVTLGISGANYVISDASGVIALSEGALAAGFGGGGTNSVSGPNDAVESLSFLLGDQSDSFQINGLTDPLTVLGEAGADTIVLNNAVTPGGALVLNAETVTLSSGITGATSVSIAADTLSLLATIEASGRVTISHATASRTINLGPEVTNMLTLSSTELDFITADVLEIAGGPIVIADAFTFETVNTLRLTGGNITGMGALEVSRLAIKTGNTVNLFGSNDVDFLAVECNEQNGSVRFYDPDGYTIANVDSLFGIGGFEPNTTNLRSGTGVVTFDSTVGLHVVLKGTTEGSKYDQLEIVNSVNLNGVSLTGFLTFAPPLMTTFRIIDNLSSSPIIGTFAGLPEGGFTTIGNNTFAISYVAGTGNDVELTTLSALTVRLSADRKSATFRDVDGDLVTVRSTKGRFIGSEFSGASYGPDGPGRLEKLTLGAEFAGSNITISAKRTSAGGNGFVNVGSIDATLVDLGVVKIDGDLGRIHAGTDSDPKTKGVKSLIVQSLGQLDTNTASLIKGSLGSLTVKGDLSSSVFGVTGKIGTANVGGSVAPVPGGSGLYLGADDGIGKITISGDIRATEGLSTIISVPNGAIGSITVGGSIVGTAAMPMSISAFGQFTTPTKGQDIAINRITVKGSIEFTRIVAGIANADASIGSIKVVGDWLGSSAIAGHYGSGADNTLFTNDDTRGTNAVRNIPGIIATISSFIVKGQAFGTSQIATDMHGVLAERIGKARIGGVSLPLTNSPTPEAFFAATTLTGAGAEAPMFDFIIREFGATTPVAANP